MRIAALLLMGLTLACAPAPPPPPEPAPAPPAAAAPAEAPPEEAPPAGAVVELKVTSEGAEPGIFGGPPGGALTLEVANASEGTLTPKVSSDELGVSVLAPEPIAPGGMLEWALDLEPGEYLLTCLEWKPEVAPALLFVGEPVGTP